MTTVKTQHREFPHAVLTCLHRKSQKSTIEQKNFKFYFTKKAIKKHFFGFYAYLQFLFMHIYHIFVYFLNSYFRSITKTVQVMIFLSLMNKLVLS